MFPPVRITAPVEPPVSLADLKAHLRIDGSDEDALLESLADSACAYLDGWSGVLGRCLINQTWRQDFSGWAWMLRLPFPDVSVVTVKYRDADDVEQTVDASLYEIVSLDGGPRVGFRGDFTYPTLSNDLAAPVSVAVTAGYGAAAANVPRSLCQAILLLVGHWYAQRELAGPGAEAPFAVSALISPYRRGIL